MSFVAKKFYYKKKPTIPGARIWSKTLNGICRITYVRTSSKLADCLQAETIAKLHKQVQRHNKIIAEINIFHFRFKDTCKLGFKVVFSSEL